MLSKPAAAGPFAGLLLADYGATVLRLDRAAAGAHTAAPPPPTADLLTRRKASIAVDLKSAGGAALVAALLPHLDVVIDPFRPGVLEAAGLAPQAVMLRANPRLVVARLTGFRRDGRYARMAGHDVNYIGASGALALLGRRGAPPYPPANLVGDFAGGGAMCVVGVLLALLARAANGGRGQVVEANMVDGSAYLATMPRLCARAPIWDRPRGENVLDGGCPYYDVYETRDGRFMAVGALEPQFFAALLAGLGIGREALGGPREDRETWPRLRELLAGAFRGRTRAEWERVFDGTDACCTPVLTHAELQAERGFEQRPPVTLTASPGLAIARLDGAASTVAQGQGAGVEGEGWTSAGLSAGAGGEELLARWLGWTRGRQYELEHGGLVKIEGGSKL